MKKLFSLLTALVLLVLPLQTVFADEPLPTPAALPLPIPAEHAAEQEKAILALHAHTPGAVVDYALRERDDGRDEWDLFFVLDNQMGVCEVLESDFSVRRVRLYDMPEGALTASQAVAALAQEKGDMQILDLELDLDDGRLRYEGEALMDGRRYDFELSVTGKLIEWERD